MMSLRISILIYPLIVRTVLNAKVVNPHSKPKDKHLQKAKCQPLLGMPYTIDWNPKHSTSWR